MPMAHPPTVPRMRSGIVTGNGMPVIMSTMLCLVPRLAANKRLAMPCNETHTSGITARIVAFTCDENAGCAPALL